MRYIFVLGIFLIMSASADAQQPVPTPPPAQTSQVVRADTQRRTMVALRIGEDERIELDG
jgi:hypothetical protein